MCYSQKEIFFQDYENMLKFSPCKDNPQEFWDKNSHDFYQRGVEGGCTSSSSLVKVLKLKDIYSQAFSFLDVGCGFGRHMKMVEDKASRCVGVDVSCQMIEYARKHLKDREGISFYHGNWSDEKFILPENNFDVVFSSMSGALDSWKNIEKFISYSKNYCIVERFLEMDNHIFDAIPEVSFGRPYNKWQYSYGLISLLWQKGYCPESLVSYINKEVSVSQEVVKFLQNSNIEHPLKDEILNLHENGREYKYTNHVIKMIIFWKINKRRKI